MHPEKPRHREPAVVGPEFRLVLLTPLLHGCLIGRDIRSAQTDEESKHERRRAGPRDRGHDGYFFPSAPASWSDLGSERFFGEAFCKALTMSCPALVVPTLWPITTSRAETFLP